MFAITTPFHEFNTLTNANDKGTFNKATRQWVREKLNLSSASLSNYLRFLLEKKFIKRNDDDNYEVHDVIKVKNSKVIEYTFILENKS